jgi:succinate dehydrogenase assembly factor 1
MAQAARVRVRKHSGLQQQVLSLYRDCLRAAGDKLSEQSRIVARQYVKDQFRRNSALSRSDFQRIEFLIRQGKKQLEVLGAPDVDGFAVATMRR